MTGMQVPERLEERQESRNHLDAPSLQSSWRAHADQLPHQQPQIEAGGVDQQPLTNGGMPTQVDPLNTIPLRTIMLSRMKAFQSFEQALDFAHALVLDGAPVTLPIANDATLRGQSDPIGAGMAMVLDVFLAKGYEPDGFEQREGFRVYRYKPFGEPAASPRT